MATAWRIQVLTPDYLVEGLYDESNDNDTAMYFFRGRVDNSGALAMGASLHLTSVQMQPTRNTATQATSAPEWWSFPNNLVAVMPYDAASLADIQKHVDSKNVIPADIYVGPYRIRGSILSPHRELSALRYYFNFVVQNAEIACLEADAKLPIMRAPYAIVRTHLVQSIVRNA